MDGEEVGVENVPVLAIGDGRDASLPDDDETLRVKCLQRFADDAPTNLVLLAEDSLGRHRRTRLELAASDLFKVVEHDRLTQAVTRHGTSSPSKPIHDC